MKNFQIKEGVCVYSFFLDLTYDTILDNIWTFLMGLGWEIKFGTKKLQTLNGKNTGVWTFEKHILKFFFKGCVLCEKFTSLDYIIK